MECHGGRPLATAAVEIIVDVRKISVSASIGRFSQKKSSVVKLFVQRMYVV
jgi:hypothetical protein